MPWADANAHCALNTSEAAVNIRSDSKHEAKVILIISAPYSVNTVDCFHLSGWGIMETKGRRSNSWWVLCWGEEEEASPDFPPNSFLFSSSTQLYANDESPEAKVGLGCTCAGCVQQTQQPSDICSHPSHPSQLVPLRRRLPKSSEVQSGLSGPAKQAYCQSAED